MNDKPQENRTSLPEAQPAAPGATAENPMIKKRWFGRGIYGSKDVPIRVLDTCIVIMVIAAVILTIWGAATSGFSVSFDTGISDVTVETQKVRHGDKAAEPEAPLRPGYVLTGWSTTPDPDINYWNFSTRTVENDLTLYAIWQPAEVTVKFDVNGGEGECEPVTVTYGQPYGALPTPTKPGSSFAGWVYSGEVITADTIVTMTGEHILQATWK